MKKLTLRKTIVGVILSGIILIGLSEGITSLANTYTTTSNITDMYLPNTKVTMELTEDSTYQLKAVGIPNSERYSVAWSSSNHTTAMVDNNGLVTAIGTGTSIITIKVTDNNPSYTQTATEYTSSCEVKIVEEDTQYINLSQNVLKTNPETSHQLTVSGNVSGYKLAWSFADKSIATVDDNGVVTIHGVGETIIAVAAEGNDSLVASCKVYVSELEITSIAMDIERAQMAIGESLALSTNATPENLEYTVLWASSDENITTVDDSGVVTALSEGEAIIYAQVEGKEIYAYSTIEVLEDNTNQEIEPELPSPEEDKTVEDSDNQEPEVEESTEDDIIEDEELEETIEGVVTGDFTPIFLYLWTTVLALVGILVNKERKQK